MRHYAIAAALVALLALVGCGANSAATHPGQINAFDGAAYDTLVTVQASIQQSKGLEPQFPQYKTQLNQVIASYNAAIAAYKLYHTSAAGAPSASTLQTQLTDLVNAVAKLLTDMGVKIP